MEIAEALVLVDFGWGFELSGAEITAVLSGVGECLLGRISIRW